MMWPLLLALLAPPASPCTPLDAGFAECSEQFSSLGRTEVYALKRASGRAPALLLLHGAGRDHRTLLADPATRKALADFPGTIVMPRGRASWWVDSDGSRYESFLLELMDRIGAESWTAAGWSMGGFGSLRLVVRHPERFAGWGGILALADFPNAAYPRERNHAVPALFGPSERWPGWNPLALVEKLRGKRVWFSTGETAFDRGMNEALDARLTALGIAHEFHLGRGAHEFSVVARDLAPMIQAVSGGRILMGTPRTVRSEPGKHFGFPRMIRAADGALLLFYRAGTTHASDRAVIVVRRSADEGLTWSPEQQIAQGSDEQHGAQNVVAMLGANGRVIAWLGNILIAPPRRREPTWWRWSDDHGRTWSPLTLFDRDPGRSTYYITDAIPVSDGLLACSASFPPGGVGNCYAEMWHSADGGRTWQVRSQLTRLADNRGDEVGLIETAPSHVLCLLRSRRGKGLAQFRSSDNGRTWTEGEDLGVSLGCTLQRPFLTRLDKSRVLLSGRDLDRKMVVAYLSEDNARTWGHRTVIEKYKADGAYTACVPLKDGSVLMTWYTDAHTAPRQPEIKTVKLWIR